MLAREGRVSVRADRVHRDRAGPTLVELNDRDLAAPVTDHLAPFAGRVAARLTQEPDNSPNPSQPARRTAYP